MNKGEIEVTAVRKTRGRILVVMGLGAFVLGARAAPVVYDGTGGAVALSATATSENDHPGSIDSPGPIDSPGLIEGTGSSVISDAPEMIGSDSLSAANPMWSDRTSVAGNSDAPARSASALAAVTVGDSQGSFNRDMNVDCPKVPLPASIWLFGPALVLLSGGALLRRPRPADGP